MKDEARTARHIEQDVPDTGKNPAAVALGRLGGPKGGNARAAKFSPRKLQEIARVAAWARWKKDVE